MEVFLGEMTFKKKMRNFMNVQGIVAESLCQWSLVTISGNVGEVEVIIAEPLFLEARLESSRRTPCTVGG